MSPLRQPPQPPPRPNTADKDYEWEYALPYQHLTKYERFCRTLYNSETHAVLGRNAKSWIQLLVFYTTFYIGLAILFAICMKGLLSTVSTKEPRWMLDKSLIGTNPGLGFRPMPPKVEEGSLIWFVPSNETNVKYWVNSIDEFLKVYTEPPKTKAVRQICDYDTPPAEGKVCNVDVNSDVWGKCTSKQNYGYSTSSPCVFLKLNRIYGWVPDYYNTTQNLPAEMPADLKNYIKSISADKNKLNTIWVSCHGEGPLDNESIGPIEYYPQPGFPGYFYPFQNDIGYLSPIVAIHFKRPLLHRIINIECRIWAKNAFYRKNPKDREGAVHFELQLD